MPNLTPGRSYLYSGSNNALVSILAEFSSFDQQIIDADNLEVKSLRTLIATLQLAAADRRVLLIQNAHSLSDITQNTLLKLLEEPPSTLVIVLQTDQLHRLMPTVQSRLHQITTDHTIEKIPGSTLFDGQPKAIFDRLAKLDRTDLVSSLSNEMVYQRQILLESSDLAAGGRVERLNLAINKLLANANQKLTLDWLLLH